MSSYVPAATSSLMTRPRAHTHTSADTGSSANLVLPSFVPSRPPGAVRAQGPPHGHPGQRTVSASVMDVANRGFAPPSPGLTNNMMSLPPPPPGGPPANHGMPLGVPPPPPMKDHPAHNQNWNSWSKGHGGPQWTQGAQYQPHQPQQQQALYIPHQTPTSHHSPGMYGNSTLHQPVHHRPQDLDLSSERSFRPDSDDGYLVNPRSILAANQNQTATISRHPNMPLQSPSTAGSVQPISPDHGLFWTPERVIAWLDRNSFSQEWQDAFRNLNIHGMDFLELGQRYSSQLQQAILPEVLRLYGPNADPEREKRAGKKIKGLVREITKLGQNAPPVPMSPAYSEGSGRQAKPNATRRVTLSEMYDNPSGQSDPRSTTDLQSRAASDQQVPTRRAEYTKLALGGMNNVRGQSPSGSVASLHGGHSQGPYASSSRGLQDSPQSSPSPSYQNMQGRHAKTNSQESIASSVYRDGPRWAVVDNSQKTDAKARNNGRPSTSHEKETSSKFGGARVKEFFSRKKTRDDDSHGDTESPSSPSFRENSARLEKQVPNLPFIHEHNHSDSSIATASTVSEQERALKRVPGHRQVSSSSGVPQEKYPLRVFATTNLKHFALVDLTELESADAIRKTLCLSLNILDWETAAIYHTEVGQTEHEEYLSDHMLLVSRRHADDKATVKFYIEQPVPTLVPTSVIQPQVSAPTQSVSESRQIYPLNPVNGITRKPISLEPNSATVRRQSRQPPSNFNSHAQTGQQHEYQNKQVEKVLEKKQEPPGSDSLDDLLGRLNDFKTRQDAGALPEGPKIDITEPRSPIAVPAGPRPSVQPTPIDHDDPMYNSTIGVWGSYDNNGLKVQRGSTTESSPIEFNPSEDASRDELFFGQSSTYISDPNQQSSEFKVVADQYKKKREMELEQKRRKDQGLRLQQQTADRNSGFARINSPDKKVIDFDNPRASPFEDKSFEHMIPNPLVPHRKPPPPPAETLSRSSIGSLSKKGVDTFRRQFAETSGYVGTTRKNSIVRRQEMREQGTMRKAVPPVPAEGASSFVSSRRMSIQERGLYVMPGDNLPSSQPFAPQQGREMPSIDSVSASGSPHSVGPPGYGWEQPQEFTVPDYQAGALENPPVVMPNQHTPGSPVPVSPGDELRKGFGEVEFVENEVTFMPTPQIPQQEDDSDSDDGLFAIPLTGKTTKPKDTPPSSDSGSGRSNTNESQKPALTVSTKGVTFRETPVTSAVGGSTAGSTPSSLKNVEFHEGDDKHLIYPPAGNMAPSPRSAGPVHSPADYPIKRPTSFIDEDWASRPAPETLIDNLDELFPNLDLDQPLIDDSAVSSPPPSPSPATERPRMSSSALPMPGDDMPVVSAVREEDEDNMPMPENPALKNPRPSSVAVRNVGRSSGALGRMKSIREVARGAHERGKKLAQQQQQQPVGSGPTAGGMDKQAMLRRKSTKLFGARLIEVKPGQGKRELRQAQTQEPPPQSQWPKRQATFKWFKGPLIGKGTYGRVYLGMNATTGDFLAVKQVEVNRHASNGDSELLKEMIAALNQEIETMQHLDHVNIVQYLGCERKEMSISIFLEYIPGGSIGSCLRKHGKFDEPIVRSLTRQTLSGLEYLHREGILHRDLKADNILLDKTGTCKISDFGISKKSENIYGNDPGNSMQGSVFWMAPEVIRPEGQGYSAKIDIWSLGCVVIEMFAGRRPWSKEEAIGAIYKLGSKQSSPPVPDDVAPFISPEAIGFLADCHTIEPAERPTARTLLGHPFCAHDEMFDFRTTTLYELVQDKERPVPVPVQPKYQ